MTDIVFLDTETLGLDPDAPVWEFAAVRRPDADPQRSVAVEHFTIQHDPASYLEVLREEFAADYRARYDASRARTELGAALAIHSITRAAIVVGCNPGFDIERLAKLLTRNGIEPEWHYHPLDSASIAIGYLAARGQLPEPPWKSDALSAALGVEPATFDRHTAMGDVRWVMAQWDTAMGSSG